MSKYKGNEDVVYRGQVWHVCKNGHISDKWNGHKYYKIYRGNEVEHVRGDSLWKALC